MCALHDLVAQAGCSIDSRSLRPGQVFVAIQGDRFDGHDHLAQAKAKGASAAVVAKPVAIDLPLFQVKDTRLALGEMAKRHRQRFDLPIIALTGSCGKTSLKEMLATILKQQHHVLATQGNYNNDIGVPLTLLQLNAKHDIAVIEIGTNSPGEIAYLAQLVEAKVAILNNVHPAHIGFFGSLDAIAEEKSAIFLAIDASGTAVFEAGTQYSERFQAKLPNNNYLSFSLHVPADVMARDIHYNAQMQPRFQLVTPAGEISVGLQVSGAHNVANALAATAACLALGFDLTQIKTGLEQVQAYPGRFVITPGHQQARIIDDTYNANLGSVTAALEVLAGLAGRRIFVLGDLGELGAEEETQHRQIGELARDFNIDAMYTYGKLSALSSTAFNGDGAHFTDQQALIDALLTHLDAQTTVLIKGSRTAKMENVVRALT